MIEWLREGRAVAIIYGPGSVDGAIRAWPGRGFDTVGSEHVAPAVRPVQGARR